MEEKRKRKLSTPCPFCGTELVEVFEEVDNSNGKKIVKPTKWNCPDGCGTWIPNEENIMDIWNDEQRYKKSISSPGGRSIKVKRKRQKPVRWIDDYRYMQ